MKKTIAILLLMPYLLLCAVSCQKETVPQQCGISMKEREVADFPVETRDLAKETVKGFLTDLSDRVGSLSSSVSNKIKDQTPMLTEQIESVFYEERTDAVSYEAFFDDLARRSDDYAAMFCRLVTSSVEEGDTDLARELFSLVFTTFGDATFTGIARGLVLCQYDFSINDDLALAQKYESVPALADRYRNSAAETERKKEIFRAIDPETFDSLSRSTVLLSAVLLSDGFDEETFAAFTDEELRAVAGTPDFAFTLSDEEWGVLLELTEKLGGFGKLTAAVRTAGDTDKLTSFLNGTFSWLTLVQRELTAEDVAALRAADPSRLVSVGYGRLSETAKERLDELCSLTLDGGSYRAVIADNAALRDFFNTEIRVPADFADPENDPTDVLRGILRGVFYD